MDVVVGGNVDTALTWTCTPLMSFVCADFGRPTLLATGWLFIERKPTTPEWLLAVL